MQSIGIYEGIKDYHSPEIPSSLTLDAASQFDYAYAPLRMTRAKFFAQRNMSFIKSVLVKKEGQRT